MLPLRPSAVCLCAFTLESTPLRFPRRLSWVCSCSDPEEEKLTAPSVCISFTTHTERFTSDSSGHLISGVYSLPLPPRPAPGHTKQFRDISWVSYDLTQFRDDLLEIDSIRSHRTRASCHMTALPTPTPCLIPVTSPGCYLCF